MESLKNGICICNSSMTTLNFSTLRIY